jgi:hypothetical protein
VCIEKQCPACHGCNFNTGNCDNLCPGLCEECVDFKCTKKTCGSGCDSCDPKTGDCSNICDACHDTHEYDAARDSTLAGAIM